MSITLKHIEAKQSEIQQLIARFKAEQPRTLTVAEASIELATGEVYAGLILNEDGTPAHHLVLLPGQAEELEWDKAIEWASEQGGELPTRREQALLYANCKQHFEAAGYWSSQQHESNSSWAWCQYFLGGTQGHDRKSYGLRARAVRRLIIE